MKDFGRWLHDFALPAPASKDCAPDDDCLPDGVSEHDGAYFAVCCVCGKDDVIEVDIKDIPPRGYQHYCVGSPRCCP